MILVRALIRAPDVETRGERHGGGGMAAAGRAVAPAPGGRSIAPDQRAARRLRRGGGGGGGTAGAGGRSGAVSMEVQQGSRDGYTEFTVEPASALASSSEQSPAAFADASQPPSASASATATASTASASASFFPEQASAQRAISPPIASTDDDGAPSELLAPLLEEWPYLMELVLAQLDPTDCALLARWRSRGWWWCWPIIYRLRATEGWWRSRSTTSWGPSRSWLGRRTTGARGRSKRVR